MLPALVAACSNAGQSEKKNEDPTGAETVQPALLSTTEIAIDGMTCTGCEEAIKNSVRKLEGIEGIEASHTEKKAAVTYDSTRVTLAEIDQAIVDAGYTVTGHNRMD